MVRSERGPVKPARPRAARAMHEFFSENLRNPARNRRAGLMRQFCPSQLDSTCTYIVVQNLAPYRNNSNTGGRSTAVDLMSCSLAAIRGPRRGPRRGCDARLNRARISCTDIASTRRRVQTPRSRRQWCWPPLTLARAFDPVAMAIAVSELLQSGSRVSRRSSPLPGQRRSERHPPGGNNARSRESLPVLWVLPRFVLQPLCDVNPAGGGITSDLPPLGQRSPCSPSSITASKHSRKSRRTVGEGGGRHRQQSPLPKVWQNCILA
jgi:hypothetical protein